MMEPTTLKGRTAIVTGAGRGIGRAISLRLAKAGAKVVLVARSMDQLEETRTLIERGGGVAVCSRGDVTREEDAARVVEEARRFGGVDVLVNNAGVAPSMMIDAMTPAVFDEIVQTNIRSVFLFSKAVWPAMSRNKNGTIVNIASVAAYDAFPGLAAYGAAKAFVVAYTKGLAVEGAAHGIRVFGVAPGAVETVMLRGVVPDYPKEQTLAPDDVAALVEMLLSPACRHSSGETIKVFKA